MYSFDPNKLELRELHGLMIGSIAPRPIALVSTQSADGVDNLAPFSFFNAFSSNPPVVAFSPAKRGRDGTFKDTYNNLVETKECVVHIVTRDMVEQINLASTEFPTDVDEFLKSGLTKLASTIVKPFRVKESPMHMECTLRDMIALGDKNASGNLAICDVVQFHIQEDMYQNGRVILEKMNQVGRNGGHYYTACNEDSMFEVPAPRTDIGIGWDELPAWLFEIGLSKNELAQLALIQELPEGVTNQSGPVSDEDCLEVKELLSERKIKEAWSVFAKRS